MEKGYEQITDNSQNKEKVKISGFSFNIKIVK